MKKNVENMSLGEFSQHKKYRNYFKRISFRNTQDHHGKKK